MKISEQNRMVREIKDMPISAVEMISSFKKARPDLVEAMLGADHNYSKEHISPFHAEGDVWTHTMMVVDAASVLNSPKEALLSALIHDIGKPSAMTVDHEKKRVRFLGHEGISFYMAVRLLKETYGDVLTKNEVIMTLKIIACHSELFSWGGDANSESIKSRFAGQQDFLYKLAYQATSDWNGRIAVDRTGPPDLISIARTIDLPAKELKIDGPCLTILIGPPAAGKSTYIESLDGVFSVVSRDAILEEITAGLDYNDKWQNQDSSEVNRILDKEFQDNAKSGENIVIDMTNMSKKSRRKWLSHHWIKKNNYRTKAVVFATDYDALISRNENRVGKEISPSVIHRMMRSFCFPMADEFDEVVVLLEGDDCEYK